MKSEGDMNQYVRKILRTPEFMAFYRTLPPKVQTKFQYVMNVIASVYNVSTKFVKHLEKTDLYEMRVSWKTQAWMTPEAKVYLTPENILFLTPEEIGRRGHFYFGLSAF